MVDVHLLLEASLPLVDLCRRVYVVDSATKIPVACDAEEVYGSEQTPVVVVVFHNLWALPPVVLHIATNWVEAESVRWIVI